MPLAITRAVSRSLADCQLSHLPRVEIDLERARAQHAAYARCLRDEGYRVHELPEEPTLPDSVFVEDTAVVLGAVAIGLRPGAPSRRPEVTSVAAALAEHIEVEPLGGTGTVDGGDVLVHGRELFVGRSARTDAAGIEALEAAARRHGYALRTLGLRDCLHLKSALCALDEETLLVNRAWLAQEPPAGRRLVEADPVEPFAANVVRLRGALLHAAEHPRTRARLEDAGYRVVAVEAGELAKAEGGVTCCSLLLEGID